MSYPNEHLALVPGRIMRVGDRTVTVTSDQDVSCATEHGSPEHGSLRIVDSAEIVWRMANEHLSHGVLRAECVIYTKDYINPRYPDPEPLKVTCLWQRGLLRWPFDLYTPTMSHQIEDDLLYRCERMATDGTLRNIDLLTAMRLADRLSGDEESSTWEITARRSTDNFPRPKSLEDWV